MFEAVRVIRHPLVAHRLAELRRKETPSGRFRALVEELAMFLTYEAAADFSLREVEIETPLARCTAGVLVDGVVIVPILRAGLAMLEGALRVFPDAAVGHIGLFRDEATHAPVEYYKNIPALAGKTVVMVDPMLATGGSASAALRILKESGAGRIIFVNIVAAPVGLEKIAAEHPDVRIFTAAIDDHLNENCYIVPGLGDAGDRIFGTGA